MDQQNAAQDVQVSAVPQTYEEDVPVESAPQQNQNGAQANGHSGVQYTPVTVTERRVEQRPFIPNPNFGMNRINNRQQETERTKTDRDFIEALANKPESIDYVLIPYRQMPRCKTDGTSLKQGKLLRPNGEPSSFEIMSYDNLVDEIARAWGGGSYRVVVTDRTNGRQADVNRVIMVGIPTDNYPPKAEEYEQLEAVAPSKNGTGHTKSEELERIELEEAEEKARERVEAERHAREMRQRKRDYEQLKQEKEMEAMRKGLLTPAQAAPQTDPQLVALMNQIAEDRRLQAERDRKAEDERKEERRRYEDEKKEAQRKAEELQKQLTDQRIESQRQLMELMTKVNQPKDDGIKEMMIALIGRPQPQLPPPPDHMPLFMEMNKQSTQIISAALQRPVEDKTGPMMDRMLALNKDRSSATEGILNSLMTAVIGKPKNELNLDTMLKLIELGKSDAREMFQMMQGAQATPEGGEGEAWDPKIGVLGNVGKQIFGGLKSIMQMAVESPQLQELLLRLVGSRRPTQEQMVQAAYNMEQSGMLPNGVGQPMLTGPTYQPTNVPGILPSPMPPMPQQQRKNPQRQPQPIQPTVQSQQQPVAQPAQAQPQANQQQQVLNELESEASGLPSNDGPAQEDLTPEQIAEQQLRETVTETIEELIKEVVANPLETEWPEYGAAHINQRFLKALIEQPSDQLRFHMLQQKCHAEVWQRFIAAMNNTAAGAANQQEAQVRFQQANMKVINDLHRMIDIAKNAMQAAAIPAPVPTPPVPAPQPTVEVPPQPQPVQ